MGAACKGCVVRGPRLWCCCGQGSRNRRPGHPGLMLPWGIFVWRREGNSLKGRSQHLPWWSGKAMWVWITDLSTSLMVGMVQRLLSCVVYPGQGDSHVATPAPHTGVTCLCSTLEVLPWWCNDSSEYKLSRTSHTMTRPFRKDSGRWHTWGKQASFFFRWEPLR